MKININSLLLTAMIVLLSAVLFLNGSTVSQNQPKQTLTVTYRAMFGLEDDLKKSIDSHVKQGWVVKSVALMDDDTWSKGIVVFEKY